MCSTTETSCNVSGLVRLNVGGVWYTTTRATLLTQPRSLFHTMLQTDLPSNQNGFHGNENNKTDSGYYFIDRDGQLFRYILNYLRSGELSCPADFTEHAQLAQEAQFFRLDKLEALIERMRNGSEHYYLEVIEIAHPEKLGLCGARVVISPEIRQVAPLPEILAEGAGEAVEGQRGRMWIRSPITRLEWAEKLKALGWNYCGNVAFVRKIPDITGHGTDMAHVLEKWQKQK